jgi:hypothetical protein
MEGIVYHTLSCCGYTCPYPDIIKYIDAGFRFCPCCRKIIPIIAIRYSQTRIHIRFRNIGYIPDYFKEKDRECLKAVCKDEYSNKKPQNGWLEDLSHNLILKGILEYDN